MCGLGIGLLTGALLPHGLIPGCVSSASVVASGRQSQCGAQAGPCNLGLGRCGFAPTRWIRLIAAFAACELAMVCKCYMGLSTAACPIAYVSGVRAGPPRWSASAAPSVSLVRLSRVWTSRFWPRSAHRPGTVNVRIL